MVFKSEVVSKQFVRECVHKVSHEGLHNLRLQYNELRTFNPVNVSHDASDSNPEKCRYRDIVCFDSTRVTIHWPTGTTQDFVHANWVTHELFENKFICAQAPMDNTVCDFWRLCWQENVRQIIMLCRCEEMGRSKSAQYWPNQEGQKRTLECGLKVKCSSINRSDSNIVVTKLQLKYNNTKRTVYHRQWVNWPDKSVPTSDEEPFKLLKYARKEKKNPTLVHCSAGVGRTGTLIAIELMHMALKKSSAVGSLDLVKCLRSQRFLMVQTEEQFIYAHLAVIRKVSRDGLANQNDVDKFSCEYRQYRKAMEATGGKLALNETK
ncbi:protein-tyrosine phosphatase domain-containing protein [Ditylenchus destructor]|nr:protein-tyrosine phosphatase domain-containing protein [Ditylenchus destructor]